MRAHEIICEELKSCTLSKEMRLQMAVKAVNDPASPNGLVPTLVFGTCPRMTLMDPPAPSITQRASAIRKALEEIQKLRSRRLVSDAFNQTNGSSVVSLHSLPLGSNVLVFGEEQANQSSKWTGPFELIGIENETCTVRLTSGPTKYRSTVVKEFNNVDTMGQVINEYIENQNQHIPSPQITHQPS